MRSFIEKSALLRPLNFLRVSHPYALSYNLVYPTAVALLLAYAVCKLGATHNLLVKDGILNVLAPFLAVLSPFYIAALAAISTFSGPPFLDKPFTMASAVELKIIKDGEWRAIHITPRHFLSLLFGYCTVISLMLLMVSVFSPVFSESLKSATVALMALFFVYAFFMSQLVICTLLGVYYLADRIHRR